MTFAFEIGTNRRVMLTIIRRRLGSTYGLFTKKRCYVMPDGFNGYRLERKI